MKLNVEKVIERAGKGFNERDNNRQMLEDMDEVYNPYRNVFTSSKGDKAHNKPTIQYDSAPMNSANNFVNTMQANFTPPFTRWAKLTAGPGVPEKSRKKYNKALEAVTDKIFTYLNASNFATASAEMYWEWGKGTGALWLFEGDQERPLNFMATPISQMGLVEGRFGEVDFRCRRHNIKARHLTVTWPNDKVALNGELKGLMQDKPDEEVEVLEACYYDYKDLVWRYVVIHEKSKHQLLEKTFAEEICFTPRWLKIPGFATGVGPFLMAMADAKTLMKMKEYMLRMAALNIFGVYTVANNGGFNPNAAAIAPGKFIPVQRNAGPNGPTIAALPRAGSFDVQEFMLNDLKESIRKTLLDNRLPQETPQPKTAFEIAERIKEFQVDIGSAYGRGMFEYIIPLFRRIVAILNRKGLLPELPKDFEIDNFFVQVNVVSPVANTQAMEDVRRFMQNYEMVAQVSPQLALTAYEVEKLPQFLMEKTGSSADMLREDVEMETLQQAIIQQVSQMVAAQAQGQQAQ